MTNNHANSNRVRAAIDVAKNSHLAAVRVPGRRKPQCFRIANTKDEFERLAGRLSQPGLAVEIAFEATGNYHRPLAWFLSEKGFKLRLVSSVSLARTRQALHQTWDKNDHKDACILLYLLEQGITQTWCDPLRAGFHDWQELSDTYWQVSLEKTRLQHRLLTHYLPLYFPEAARYHHSGRSEWLFRLLQRFPTPGLILAQGLGSFLEETWSLAGRKINKRRVLEDFYQTASESIGLPIAADSQALEMFRLVLTEFLEMAQRRDQIEARAERLLAEDSDARRLRTIPGIGPIIALTIRAEAGDLRRFQHHRQFLRFCGLDLSTVQSGQYRGQTRLSKCGNRRLRTAFWTAAKVAVRMRENCFRAKYDRYVRRDPLNPDLRRKAATAVAAKMARVAHGLIKSGTEYRLFHEEVIPGGGALSLGPSRRFAIS